MNIYRPGLEAIVSQMIERRKGIRASKPIDVHALSIVESIIICAVHQLSLKEGEDEQIIESAQELLEQQAKLLRHDRLNQ